MKLITINYLREWYTGSLQVPNLSQVKGYLADASQEKYHPVIKNGDEGVAFVFLYKLDSNYFYYILAGAESKEYIGHCLIKNVKSLLL